MQLFYNPKISKETTTVIFDKTESRHIVKVLRKKEEDILYITNGKGFLFTSKISFASDKKCIVEIINFEIKEKPWNYHIHIAIAPTKNNDRLEWFLEKATEIGIDEITPIICQNSERKIIKKERLEKILQSAIKQSLKCRLPKLNNPIKFNDFITENKNNNCYIAHCEKSDKKSLKSILSPQENSIILIGPEGDFSSQEIQTALKNNYSPISLGESRLRTETAALKAVLTVSFVNE